MDYEEFLWALGDTTTPVLLQNYLPLKNRQARA